MSDITADEAHRLREAATPGPWVIDKDGDVVHPVSDNSRDDKPVVFVEFWPLGPEVHADQALIVAAPSLAAEVERLSADNERLRVALGDAIGCVEEWAAYASDYFKEKWDLAGDLARLTASLADEGGE